MGAGRIALAAVVVAVGAGARDAEAQATAAGFAWEVAGGAVGSLAGFGLGYAASDDDCGDDLACVFRDVAFVLALASAGSALGTVVAGEMVGSEPSRLGAVLGAVAGAAAGLGVTKLLDEAGASWGPGPLIAFSVTQGALTAAGARLLSP